MRRFGYNKISGFLVHVHVDFFPCNPSGNWNLMLKKKSRIQLCQKKKKKKKKVWNYDLLYNLSEIAQLTYEELVSKISYIHPDMLLICIIVFLLQLK